MQSVRYLVAGSELIGEHGCIWFLAETHNITAFGVNCTVAERHGQAAGAGVIPSAASWKLSRAIEQGGVAWPGHTTALINDASRCSI